MFNKRYQSLQLKLHQTQKMRNYSEDNKGSLSGHVPLPPKDEAKSKALHLPNAIDIKDTQICRNPGCNKRTTIQTTNFFCV